MRPEEEGPKLSIILLGSKVYGQRRIMMFVNQVQE